MTEEPMTDSIRVLVADDQAIARAGLRMLLDGEHGIEVVGEADTGRRAVSSVDLLRPDVVLMDVRMPDLDGIEATRAIVGRPAAPAVLVLTTFELDEYVFGALRAGASGFLVKDSDPQRLVDAVRTVHRGDMVLGASTTRRVVEAAIRPPSAHGDSMLDRLSEREREVFIAVAGGLSNLEIANRLYVSENTVKTHVGSILAKLGLSSRIQVVIAAYEWQVVPTRDPAPER